MNKLIYVKPATLKVLQERAKKEGRKIKNYIEYLLDKEATKTK